jgi:hypothetical protein
MGKALESSTELQRRFHMTLNSSGQFVSKTQSETMDRGIDTQCDKFLVIEGARVPVD